MSVNASFNGMGKPIPGVVISSCRVVIVFLPLAFLGRALFDLPGLFAATTLSNLLMGAIGFAWLGRQINQARSTSPQPTP
jgi:Na+-driven multidrug efflux pump